MSLIMKRNSIRSYTDELVSKETILKLLKSGMQAPSANNQQPWEFIVVDDRKLLDELSETSKGAWMLKDAPVAIIPMILESDKSPHFRVQDLSAATQNILLEVTNQNLGAVWIGVYPLEDRVNHIEKVLNITGTAHPFAIIAIGHPAKQREVIVKFDESRIHFNEWRTK